MINFDVRCPKNYPLKCNLLDIEKGALVRSEKYKGFLMYQFQDQREYLVPAVKKYFSPPLYHIFDAKDESGLGIKGCKICRLALSSDFGIASLTPLNNNVFFEIGLVQGLGKPVVYLVNRDFEYNNKRGADAVPFDLSDQMFIEHENGKELSLKLEKEIPAFVDKVHLSSVYEKELMRFAKNKLASLDESKKNVLKFFVLDQSREIREGWLTDLLLQSKISINIPLEQALKDLEKIGFIRRWISPHQPGIARHKACILEEGYREILKGLLFKERSSG